MKVSEDGKIGPGSEFAKRDHADNCHELLSVIYDYSSDFVVTDEWRDAMLTEPRSLPESRQTKEPDETNNSQEEPPQGFPYQMKSVALSRAHRTTHLAWYGNALPDKLVLEKDADDFVTRDDEIQESRRLQSMYASRGEQLIKDIQDPQADPAEVLMELLSEEVYEEAWEAIFSEDVHPKISYCKIEEEFEGDERAETAQACALLLMQIQPKSGEEKRLLQVAIKNAYEVAGGLIQATHFAFTIACVRACAITQLKRVSRGLAMLQALTREQIWHDIAERENVAHLENTIEELQNSTIDLQKQAWNPSWGEYWTLGPE